MLYTAHMQPSLYNNNYYDNNNKNKSKANAGAKTYSHQTNNRLTVVTVY